MTKLTWYYHGHLDVIPEGVLLKKSFWPVQPNTCFVDRTRTIQFPFNDCLSKEHVIPEYPNKKITLLDCVEDASRNLDKENKKIYVMWSGGIDSTLMLSSLINLVDNNKLIVVCNNDSLKENYFFYKEYIRGKLEIFSTEQFTHDIKYKVFDGIILQAEHADLLFPTNVVGQMKFWMGEEFASLPANRENITNFLKAKKYDNLHANCFYDLMTESAKKSPVPIETTYEFGWWLNFNFRWQNNREKFRARINPNNDYRTFFSTALFQQWSMSNLGTEEMNNKNGFRDILRKFWNNSDYIENKTKWASMSKHFATRSAQAITENNELIYKDFKIEDYYNPKNFFAERLT